jgi:uncharacterized membrane protein
MSAGPLSHRQEQLRTGMRWLMAAFYFTAGVIHIRSPGAFLPIVPDWVPMPLETVLLTGVAEIAGAIGLMIPRLRWWAGVMLAAYAVAVFPANIKHAVEGIALAGSEQGLGYHIPRLLFQPVLVWWALFAGKVINWPFRRR